MYPAEFFRLENVSKRKRVVRSCDPFRPVPVIEPALPISQNNSDLDHVSAGEWQNGFGCESGRKRKELRDSAGCRPWKVPKAQATTCRRSLGRKRPSAMTSGKARATAPVAHHRDDGPGKTHALLPRRRNSWPHRCRGPIPLRVSGIARSLSCATRISFGFLTIRVPRSGHATIRAGD